MEKYCFSTKCGKFRHEMFTNSLLRILLEKTKNSLFMGLKKHDGRILIISRIRFHRYALEIHLLVL